MEKVQECMCVCCLCECVDALTNLLWFYTTHWSLCENLCRCWNPYMCFYQLPFSLLLSSGWVMITATRRHPSAQEHTSALVKAPDGRKPPFMSKTWWKRFPGHCFFFFLCFLAGCWFISPHRLLYLPSLSSCNDKDQIRAAVHVKCARLDTKSDHFRISR